MAISPERFAFLTPEFPTEPKFRTRGGLAAYLDRIVTALVDAGRQVEVFVISAEAAGTVAHNGAIVHRVPSGMGRFSSKALRRLLVMPGLGRLGLGGIVPLLSDSWALSRAFLRRHRAAPFDVVQSSDFGVAGLFVTRRCGAVRVVRCSWAADLFRGVDGPESAGTRLNNWLERQSIRRADLAYAPSRLVAGHLGDRFRLPVQIIRPPFAAETATGAGARAEVLRKLPPRYLVHFGQLGYRKGTDVALAATELAALRDPSLRVVFAGPEHARGIMTHAAVERGAGIYLGPLDRPTLAAVVRGSAASVLPSRVDNLPNTAIESISAGVPVIGTAGSSLDEVVRDGIDGLVVVNGDPAALAEALLRVWRDEVALSVGRDHPLFAEMAPAAAAERLVSCVRGVRNEHV